LAASTVAAAYTGRRGEAPAAIRSYWIGDESLIVVLRVRAGVALPSKRWRGEALAIVERASARRLIAGGSAIGRQERRVALAWRSRRAAVHADGPSSGPIGSLQRILEAAA
jgi:hypothetical protein